jgi:hypothetical protein
MHSMRQILFCVLIASSLAGCGRDFGRPLESGELLTFEDGREATREVLSPEQLAALSGWFEKHRSGWYGLITPASAEPTEIRLNLKHTDGKATRVSVIVQPDGGRYLRLTTSDVWAYRSPGGIFKSWAAARKVSDQDFKTLMDLLQGRPDKVIALSGSH